MTSLAFLAVIIRRIAFPVKPILPPRQKTGNITYTAGMAWHAWVFVGLVRLDHDAPTHAFGDGRMANSFVTVSAAANERKPQ